MRFFPGTMDEGTSNNSKGKKPKREQTMDDGIATSNNSNAEYDEEHSKSTDPGYKFDPDNDEIMVDFLIPKIKGQPLPKNKIREVNLYKYNPEDLTVPYKKGRDRAWFFLTSRDRKYPKGNRPNRAAGVNKPGEGFWKATGSVKNVYDVSGNKMGQRNALVFYKGKPQKETKTDWKMHEFVADYGYCNSEPVKDKNADKMRLDDWVLCKVYRKPKKGSKGRRRSAKDNQVKIDEPASSAATNVNDSSAVLEFNFPSDSMELSDEQFLNDIENPFGYNSAYGILQNPMTTNVDNQSSNHLLQLDAAPQSSMHPSLSLIDPPSVSPGNDFWYNQNSNQNSFMDYSDDAEGWHWLNTDPNIVDSLTPMVHKPLIIHENPPINNGEGHNSSSQGWTHTDKGKRPLIDNNGEDPSSSGQEWRHTERGNMPYIYNNGEGTSSSGQGWIHSEDGNRPYIDNNGEDPSSSGQGWRHTEHGNRPYIYNNGEGTSSSGQGWIHSEDGNRPYIDNNGEDPSSSGQGWRHTEHGNRPYIYNNGEGTSSSGQEWIHSEDGNRPYIDNNGEGTGNSGQEWIHSEDGNRPYIDNNGEGTSNSGQGWIHSEDGNRPYIDNNGGGHGSSGQGWRHSEDGNRHNRPYSHNNGEGSSRQGRTPR